MLPEPGTAAGDQFPAVNQAELLLPVQIDWASSGVADTAPTSKKANALKASFNTIPLWK